MTRITNCHLVAAASLLLNGFLFGPEAHAAPIWVRQFGTYEYDSAEGVSADGLGNVYVGGALARDDGFISKINYDGRLQWWIRQPTASILDVSADGVGNVYATGWSNGYTPEADISVTKYNAAGVLQWMRQLGAGRPGGDFSGGVSADRVGNVYVTGETTRSLGGPAAGGFDAFVSKFNAAGEVQWTRQLGSSADDHSQGVALDGLGNVYISGFTGGNLGGPFQGGTEDAFVAKYDSSGNLQWTQQLGTSLSDVSYDVSADALGNVYIAGNVGFAPFVSKYDTTGNQQWTRQLARPSDIAWGVATDGLGSVFVTGHTDGSLYLGGQDVFLSKYDAAGSVQWTYQSGTSQSEWSNGVSSDGLGNVYIAGWTRGDLGGPNAGDGDPFVAWFKVPEPASWLLAALGGAGFVRVSRLRLRRTVSLAAIIVAMLSATAPVQAAVLDGQTIRTDHFTTWPRGITILHDRATSVVGPGTEVRSFGRGHSLSIDFSDTNILITAERDQVSSDDAVLKFEDINLSIPPFTSAVINPATNWAGFTQPSVYISTSRESIYVSLNGLQGLQGQQVSLDIDVTPVIRESALPAPSSHNSSKHPISSEQFFGYRFSLGNVAEVESVGGHLFGSGQLFAALVSLNGETGLPLGHPFDVPPIATALLTAPDPSRDVRVPMPVTLAPGDYALVFGSGLFGAGGEGAMPVDINGPPVAGRESFIDWNPTDAWTAGRFSSPPARAPRFFVEGIVIPEPTSVALWAGLAMLVVAPTHIRPRRDR